MTGNARDSLTVFIDGEEEAGFIVYGLFEPTIWASNGHTITGPRHSEPFLLSGQQWVVVSFDVPMPAWPPFKDLQDEISGWLRSIVSAGASVAWVGAEGMPYCDPPQLFSVDHMSGGVLAAHTPDGWIKSNLNPDAPINPLNDSDMGYLRRATHGISNSN
jgi:hypothetical protein